MSHHVRTTFAVALALAVGACASDSPPPPVEVSGACTEVFKGQVCTWAKTQGGNLIEAGAVVPIASIENAPADQAMAWPPVAAAELDMPESVRQQSGMHQLTMYWEPGGHPPGAFMTPHFDFHFYSIGSAERLAMDCKDLTKPATLPTAYATPDIPLPPEMAKAMGVPALIGLCVPQMGMHALLASEIERQDPFSGNMVVGYYSGKPIFIEPMITKAMLLQKQSFELPIPSIPGLSGAHATKFRADYDATLQAYRFTFSAFTTAS